MRMLLVDYKIFREELTRVLVKLQDLRLAENLSEFDLRQSYWKSMDFVILNTINLSQRLYLLSEDDRIDLMIASDEAYKNQTNPWNLDDLEARSELFKFIANPSDEVVKAHELHEIRRING